MQLDDYQQSQAGLVDIILHDATGDAEELYRIALANLGPLLDRKDDIAKILDLWAGLYSRVVFKQAAE